MVTQSVITASSQDEHSIGVRLDGAAAQEGIPPSEVQRVATRQRPAKPRLLGRLNTVIGMATECFGAEAPTYYGNSSSALAWPVGMGHRGASADVIARGIATGENAAKWLSAVGTRLMGWASQITDTRRSLASAKTSAGTYLA
jgi:hypothetical protein